MMHLLAVALMAAASAIPLEAAGTRTPASQAPRAIDARTASLLKVLTEHYVHPDRLRDIAPLITAQSDRLRDLDDADYARALSPILIEALRDRHVLLEHRRRAIPVSRSAAPAESTRRDQQKMEMFARRVNYGFTDVRVLPDNIGYLRVDGFMPPEVGGAALAAAIDTLKATRALVVDLRESVNGGDPAMVALICAYLAGPPERVLTTIRWRGREPMVSRMPAIEPGRKLRPDMPVVVLTSRKTFSAGEELAYNLKALGRARLIGEPTAGGANPGRQHRVTDELSLFVPEGEAVSEITGSNWNWTGVQPDERVAADDAFDRAVRVLGHH